MRRSLATVLTLIGVPLAAGPLLAAEPAPAGATATIAGQPQIPFIASTPLPDRFGPYQGLCDKRKGQVKGEAGSLSVEWVLKP